METNAAPVCRYVFLLEKPVLYIRPISPDENMTTNVKFLVISRNKAYNKNLTICADNFYVEAKYLSEFLKEFGLL